MQIKKIAIDARMIKSSGIGTVIQNVLKRLIEKKEDCFFYVIGDKQKCNEFSWLKNRRVQQISSCVPIYSIQEQFDIPRLIPNDVNLLWVPHYNIPLLYGGKMIVTIHDLFHIAKPQFTKGWHKRIYANLMFKAVAKKSNHIVCVSNFTRNELIRFTNVNANKVSVIYNGVDIFWQLPLLHTKRLYNNPYILYVGNVKPHKNLSRLIMAFEKVSNIIPHDLIIVGKKEGFITNDTEVARLAKKMKSRVYFTGFVSNDELKNYYHYADLFVFPSLYEGFGLPPLEAISAGCKNIAVSDIPVFHEVYNETVSYFDPMDIDAIASQILNNLEENTFNKNMEKNLFDWDSCTVAYAKIIDKYLNEENT